MELFTWDEMPKEHMNDLIGRKMIVGEKCMIAQIFIATFGLHPIGRKHAYEDFKTDMGTPEAEAFATRFDGVHHSSPQSTSPDSLRRSVT